MYDAGLDHRSIEPLISSLYEDIASDGSWAAFLKNICKIARADCASLSFIRGSSKKEVAVVRSDGEISLNTDNVWQLVDRLNIPFSDMSPNSAYRLDQVYDKGDNRFAEFNEFVESRNVGFSHMIRTPDLDGAKGWLSVWRTSTDLEPPFAACLARVAPHIGTAVRTLHTIEKERARASVAFDAIHRLNFGWVTFDAEGRVIEIDPAARRLFDRIPQLGRCGSGSQLPLARPQRAALAQTIAGQAQAADRGPCAVHILDDPWLDMLVAPAPSGLVSGGRAPVAVGFVHGARAGDSQRPRQLMHLFGLTSTEARLADALCDGKSIAAAAGDIGITTETARNYSKRIYAKTDTRGQTDLVRFLLSSVIALV